MAVYRNEPASVPLRDVLRAREALNFVLSLGFYGICGMIALLPKAVRGGPLAAFVDWSEKVDESRHQ